jgi:hypothetical protein
MILMGVVIMLWIMIAAAVYAYSMMEAKILKKRIPEKITKEVEDGRRKRELTKEQAGREYRQTDRDDRVEYPVDESDGRNEIPGNNFESEAYEPMDNAATEQDNRRNKSNHRRNKLRRI